MEERKWEDLNSDCLVNIFGRLDLESRVWDVPLVCKQWYQALLNPLCWQQLVFPNDVFESRLAFFKDGSSYINMSELIKFVVDRSQGCATTVKLPEDFTREGLIYISDECLTLKKLILPCKAFGYYGDTISELIVKWKNLEVLKVGCCNRDMVQIIDRISVHCKNFVGLSVQSVWISHEEVSAIVSRLAGIKYLAIQNASLEKVNLVLILRGCKKLELLYVRHCVGFDEHDEEILKLASRIKDFRCEGSRTEIYDSEEYEDRISHDEAVYGDCYSD